MKKWTADGNMFVLSDVTSQVDTLPTAVYQLKYSMQIGFFLDKVSDDFKIPSKIYGNDHVFIKRVVKSYNDLPDNQGILLSGHKGGGKTLTARQISNEAKRPVILLTSSFGDADLVGYLGSIPQEVVILIDEYDKIFGESDKMLTLMDGVFNSVHKKLFILTKNDGRVSRFMVDRPGRIRYLKEYGNLEVDVIREIVEDLLENKEHLDELVDKLGFVEIITVDIIRSIIIEMNLHNMNPTEAFTHFNITLKNAFFDLYERPEEGNRKGETLLHSKVFVVGFGQIKSLDELPRQRNSYLRVKEEDGYSYDIGRVDNVKGSDFRTVETEGYDDDGNEIVKYRYYSLSKHYLFSSATVFTY